MEILFTEIFLLKRKKNMYLQNFDCKYNIAVKRKITRVLYALKTTKTYRKVIKK